MKRRIITSLAFLIILCVTAAPLMAAEGPPKKKKRKILTLAELEKRMGIYLGKDRGLKALAKAIEKLQKKKAVPYIGGEAKIEFNYFQLNDLDNLTGLATAETADSYWRIYEVKLKPHVIYQKLFEFKCELTFQENLGAEKVKLEEANVTFKGLPGGAWVKVGLDEPFIRPKDRITETYPITGSAFWEHEEYGITFGGKHKLGGGKSKLRWNFSVTKGLLLSRHNPWRNQRANTVMLVDGRFGDKEKDRVGVGFGFEQSLGKKKGDKVDAMFFAFFDRLEQTERNLLGTLPGYVGDDAGQTRMGGRFAIDISDFHGDLELIMATDGDMTRQAFSFTAGYKIKFEKPKSTGRTKKVQLFSSVMPVIRFSSITPADWAPNDDPDPGYPLTWSRSQILVGVVAELTDGVKLKAEYAINSEDTGGDNIVNDEFILQVYLTW